VELSRILGFSFPQELGGIATFHLLTVHDHPIANLGAGSFNGISKCATGEL
jgi:hypothetical protein